MGLEAIKLELIEWIANLKNEDLLKSLNSIKESKNNWQDTNKVEPMNLEKFNKEIDQALDDSKNDRGTEALVLKEKFKNRDSETQNTTK